MVDFLDFSRHHEFSYVLVVLALLGISFAMEQVRRRYVRKSELDGWIRMALKVRESKTHSVLRVDCGDAFSSSKPLSAVETRQQILSGKMNPRTNIAQIAQKCRMYGRSPDGVNAVTVEMYDEVSVAAKKCGGHLISYTLMICWDYSS